MVSSVYFLERLVTNEWNIKLNKATLNNLILFSVYAFGVLDTWRLIWTGGLLLVVNHFQGQLHTILPWRIDHGFLVNIVIYYVSYSFITYWIHRLFHNGWFWILHRFHHLPTELSPLLSTRLHPAEITLEQLPIAALAIVISDATTIVVFSLVFAWYSMFIHTNITWNLGWIGQWLIQSPYGHRIHHSIEHRGNYSIMPLWDQLFGTYIQSIDKPITLGVKGYGDRKSLLHELVGR